MKQGFVGLGTGVRRAFKGWLRLAASRTFRSYNSWLLLIGAVGLCLRLLHAWYVNYSPFSDMNAYIVFMLRAFYKQDPDSPGTLLFPPGYPYFLYLVTSLAGLQSIKPVQYAQALVDAGVIFFVAGIARFVSGCRAALWAAVVYALYLPAILNSSLLMSECLTTALLAFALWMFVKLSRRPGIIRAVLCGLAIGAATLVRSNVLLLGVTFASGLAISAFRTRHLSTKVVLSIVALLIVSAITLVPWTVRNSRIAGRPTFIATNSGVNLLIGNNVIANGGWTEFLIPDGSDKLTTDPLALPAFYQQKAVEFAKSYPLQELFYLLPQRLERLYDQVQSFWPWEYFPGGSYAEYPFGPFVYFPTVPFMPVFVIGLLGFALKSRHRWVLPATWTTLLLPLLAFFVVPRFRYVSDFLLVTSMGVLLSRIQVSSPKLFSRTLLLILLFAGFGTMLNWFRFSGPDLLQTPAFTNRSPIAEQLQHDTFTVSPPDAATRAPVSIGKLQLNSQRISDLLVSYHCRITGCGEDLDSRDIVPDIHFVYTDDAGKPISQPLTPPASVLQPVQGLSSFQTGGTTGWRIIPVPALTRYIEFQVFSRISGTVEMWGLQARGPRWYSSDDVSTVTQHP